MKYYNLITRFFSVHLNSRKLPLLSRITAANVNVQPIVDTINNMSEMLKSFASPICVLVFVVSGIALMTGQQGRQWAKPTMLFAAVGLLICILAGNLVEGLSSSLIIT